MESADLISIRINTLEQEKQYHLQRYQAQINVLIDAGNTLAVAYDNHIATLRALLESTSHDTPDGT